MRATVAPRSHANTPLFLTMVISGIAELGRPPNIDSNYSRCHRYCECGFNI
jgi:hypothetical protein